MPIDLGGTGVSGIHASVVAALRDRYGLEKRPVKVSEPYQMGNWIYCAQRARLAALLLPAAEGACEDGSSGIAEV